MKSILFTNAKLKGQNGLQDIYITDGKFKEIGPGLAAKVTAEKVVDLEGKLAVPPYVDPHIHLDYVFTALNPAAANKTGSLFEGIQRWSETKGRLTKEEIKERARQAMKQEILTGVQYIRTHVDVTDPKLTALQAMLELREEVKDTCILQIIAFPQEGMYAYQGGDKLVEEALKMGADLVGAIPHFEYTREDGVKSVQKAFELAVKYDKMVDIHCDETDDDQSRFIEVLAAEALRSGIAEKATASHTCAMHSYNNAYTYKLFKLLGLSKVNFISCPTENIHLQGRFDNYPKRRGLTRVKELNEAGINVCFAQDSMSDPWYPVGNGNLMNILDAGIHIAQMMSIEEISNSLDLITVNGARTLNILDQYGIEAGKPANFIVLNAKGEFEAVCNRVSVACSVRDGEFLFERAPEVITTTNGLLK
ncbi:cytosine deaminase [Phascolarctobacterium faecium]|uniref:cytosine deaminase n=1 Tax=Phascolarctobacterium faecium TaxID=33025 RepID=UPI003AB51B0F